MVVVVSKQRLQSNNKKKKSRRVVLPWQWILFAFIGYCCSSSSRCCHTRMMMASASFAVLWNHHHHYQQQQHPRSMLSSIISGSTTTTTTTKMAATSASAAAAAAFGLPHVFLQGGNKHDGRRPGSRTSSMTTTRALHQAQDAFRLSMMMMMMSASSEDDEGGNNNVDDDYNSELSSSDSSSRRRKRDVLKSFFGFGSNKGKEMEEEEGPMPNNEDEAEAEEDPLEQEMIQVKVQEIEERYRVLRQRFKEEQEQRKTEEEQQQQQQILDVAAGKSTDDGRSSTMVGDGNISDADHDDDDDDDDDDGIVSFEMEAELEKRMKLMDELSKNSATNNTTAGTTTDDDDDDDEVMDQILQWEMEQEIKEAKLQIKAIRFSQIEAEERERATTMTNDDPEITSSLTPVLDTGDLDVEGWMDNSTNQVQELVTKQLNAQAFAEYEEQVRRQMQLGGTSPRMDSTNDDDDDVQDPDELAIQFLERLAETTDDEEVAKGYLQEAARIKASLEGGEKTLQRVALSSTKDYQDYRMMKQIERDLSLSSEDDTGSKEETSVGEATPFRSDVMDTFDEFKAFQELEEQRKNEVMDRRGDDLKEVEEQLAKQRKTQQQEEEIRLPSRVKLSDRDNETVGATAGSGGDAAAAPPPPSRPRSNLMTKEEIKAFRKELRRQRRLKYKSEEEIRQEQERQREALAEWNREAVAMMEEYVTKNFEGTDEGVLLQYQLNNTKRIMEETNYTDNLLLPEEREKMPGTDGGSILDRPSDEIPDTLRQSKKQKRESKEQVVVELFGERYRPLADAWAKKEKLQRKREEFNSFLKRSEKRNPQVGPDGKPLKPLPRTSEDNDDGMSPFARGESPLDMPSPTDATTPTTPTQSSDNVIDDSPQQEIPEFFREAQEEYGSVDESLDDSPLGSFEDQKLKNMIRQSGAKTKEEMDKIREGYESFKEYESEFRKEVGLAGDGSSFLLEDELEEATQEEKLPDWIGYNPDDLITEDGDIDASSIVEMLKNKRKKLDAKLGMPSDDDDEQQQEVGDGKQAQDDSTLGTASVSDDSTATDFSLEQEEEVAPVAQRGSFLGAEFAGSGAVEEDTKPADIMDEEDELIKAELRKISKQGGDAVDLSWIGRKLGIDDYIREKRIRRREKMTDGVSFEERKKQLLAYSRIMESDIEILMNIRDDADPKRRRRKDTPLVYKPYDDFGVILRFEGMLFDMSGIERHAWSQTARRYGYEAPKDQFIKYAASMRPDNAVRNVFGWTTVYDKSLEIAETHNKILRQMFFNWMDKGILPEETPTAFGDGAQSIGDEMIQATAAAESNTQQEEESSSGGGGSLGFDVSRTTKKQLTTEEREEIIRNSWLQVSISFDMRPPEDDELEKAMYLGPSPAIRDIFGWTKEEFRINEMARAFFAISDQQRMERGAESVKEEGERLFRENRVELEVVKPGDDEDDAASGPKLDPRKIAKTLSREELKEVNKESFLIMAERLGLETPSDEQFERAGGTDPSTAIEKVFKWTNDYNEIRELSEFFFQTSYNVILERAIEKAESGDTSGLQVAQDEIEEAEPQKQEEEEPAKGRRRSPGWDLAIPNEGARAWIQSLLDEGMAVGVVSHFDRDIVKAMLDYSGFDELISIDNCVTATDGYKREGQHLLGTCLRIERRVDHCTVLEVTPEMVREAVDLGMKCIGFVGIHRPWDLAAAVSTTMDFERLTPFNLRKQFAPIDNQQLEFERVGQAAKSRPVAVAMREGEEEDDAEEDDESSPWWVREAERNRRSLEDAYADPLDDEELGIDWDTAADSPQFQ